MNFSIIFVIAIVAMIGMAFPSVIAQVNMDELAANRVVPIGQKCGGTE